jgi:hypothetical protein
MASSASVGGSNFIAGGMQWQHGECAESSASAEVDRHDCISADAATYDRA